MAGSGRSEDTKTCGKVFGVIYALLFLIMSFILIGISVRICEKENYCLVFNGNEQQISQQKIYEGGRYWLGAGLSFVEFPRMQLAYVWS